MNRIYPTGKNQRHRGHRKAKCELNQALDMVNLYVHSSDAKQVTVLKVADNRHNLANA